MKAKVVFCLILLIAALGLACSQAEPTFPPNLAPETDFSFFRPTVTPTPPLTPTPTPVPTLTPTPISPPSASFSLDVESGRAPLEVRFANTSQGQITSTQWHFGEGTTSADESPSHIFTISGTYSIELTVVGPGGADTQMITDLVTVQPADPVTLEVSPLNDTLVVQEATQLVAVARDEFGNTVPRPITWVVAEGGSINENGLFTAGTVAGTFKDTIIASVEGNLTATATIIVKAGTPAHIVVEPVEVTLDIGQTQAFTVTIFDAFKNEVEDAIASWTISPDLGAFDSQGVLTPGTKAGRFPNAVRVEVVKDAKKVSAAADITVRPNPIHSVVVEPPFVVVKRGANQKFRARATDEFGNVISRLELDWHATGGEISSRGIFNAGHAPGAYGVNVSATFKESTQTAQAMVPIPPVWISGPDMLRKRCCHTATLLPNGKVLIVGGQTLFAELYDPATRSFSSIRTACAHGARMRANLLMDGTVLVTGGDTDPKCAEIYDSGAESFSKVGALNSEHWSHSSTLLKDGTVLVVGGLEGQGANNRTHSVAEVYDPGTQQFRLVQDLNYDREQHNATLLPSGSVLVTNGARSENTTGCLGFPELYDPVAETFLSISSQGLFQSCGGASTLLNNGDILITSGSGRAVIFDSDTERFAATGNMTTHRGYSVDTLLSTGEVLSTGGFVPGFPATATSEIYNPVTRKFSAIDNMSEARTSHTATLLSDGSVLVVGGARPVFTPDGNKTGYEDLISTEIWIPSDL